MVKTTASSPKPLLLGDFYFSPTPFNEVERALLSLKDASFDNLNPKQKSDRINGLLANLILAKEEREFLLPAVIHYMTLVREKNLIEGYSFSHFELWLNQFSNLDAKDQHFIRCAIAGKWIPREDYQAFFPIGSGKIYEGTHFVTAHQSPDLDTTIASFWGWLDAFSAKITKGIHVWNIPGSPPVQAEVDLLFLQFFGKDVFACLAKNRGSLTLSSMDLMTQQGFIKRGTHELALTMDHERNLQAIVLIDKDGYYLGDWRHFDVEGVRQVVMLLNNCLRWLENHMHVKLISLFAKQPLTIGDIAAFVHSILYTRICDCEPAKEFTLRQQKHLESYLQKVLGIKKGLESSFKEFAQIMHQEEIADFFFFEKQMSYLESSSFFDAEGNFLEDRPKIFRFLEKMARDMEESFHDLRLYVDRMDIALKIKKDVFGYNPQFLTQRADIEEIRAKIGTYPYLTVNYSDIAGNHVPLGIIQAADLMKPILGTVTLRDFSNREETKIPAYLEIISVIDHHKSVLTTSAPSVVIISDAQSSNAIIAEIAMRIYDKYSTGGMTLDVLDQQMGELQKNDMSLSDMRRLKRLCKKKLAIKQSGSFLIDPQREFIEYLHYVFAILDDTDLLAKVTKKDVEVMAALLNRLKSILLKKEVEIIAFDEIVHDETFVKKAAQKLMQNEDLYSLYAKVYRAKELSIEENLLFCKQGIASNLFSDTKVQNGCCRVGQTKIFAKNYPLFSKMIGDMQELWLHEATRVYEENSNIDFHLHMISTITSAEELFHGNKEPYTHQDQLWIWIPFEETALEHLKFFLNAFKASNKTISNHLEATFIGPRSKDLTMAFQEIFSTLPCITHPSLKGHPYQNLIVIHYQAGTLNSRKAMISPYLPRIEN